MKNNNDDKKLEKLYKDLEKYSNFDIDEDNTERFLDTVDEIVLENNPSSIPHILKYFDDNSEYDWVFESLTRLVDIYDNKEYIKILLNYYNIMTPNATYWLKVLIFRLLNNPSSLKILKYELMRIQDPNFITVLKNLDDGSEPHSSIINDIIKVQLEVNPN